MARKFEKQYRLHERDDVLTKSNQNTQDIDLRLDAVEEIAEGFKKGNRADVDAIVASINNDFAQKSGLLQELADGIEDGLSVDLITETEAKRFTSDDEINGLRTDIENAQLETSATGRTIIKAANYAAMRSLLDVTSSAAMSAANYTRGALLNAYPDAGRFAAAAASLTTTGFVAPTYLAPSNGTVFSDGGKFTNNNATYGGTGAALNAEVDAIVSSFKASGIRRYGPEFNIMRVVAGSGTIDASTDGGVTRYFSCFQVFTQNLPYSTTSVRLLAKTGSIIVRNNSYLTIFKNGVEQPANVIITPADGAVHIVVRCIYPNTYGNGYQAQPLYINAEPSSEYYVALPALIAGIVDVPADTGIIQSMHPSSIGHIIGLQSALDAKAATTYVDTKASIAYVDAAVAVNAGGGWDAIIEDRKASGVDGGTATSGAWRTRDLNTETYDPDGYITLAAPQFMASVGGEIEWSAPASSVNRHQTRLYNVTDGAVVALGKSAYELSNSCGTARIEAAKIYEIQHRVENSQADWGFGVAVFWGPNIYTQVKFRRT